MVFVEQLITWPSRTYPKTFGTQRYLRLESGAVFSSVFKLFERFCLNFVLKVHSDIVVIYTGLREGPA